MRKITKDLTLATAYKKWLEKLAKDGTDHPTYNSANHRFYYDVVANLLWVQQGLCAYTEMYLINPADVEPDKWVKGKFSKFEFLGQLDHYNATMKEAKGWDWDNFFMIHSDVNVKRKGQKKVNSILKPDDEKYDPFYFLQYDFKTHNFLPNQQRDFDLQQKILEDINTLGLNFKPIIDYRKETLKPLIDEVLLGKKNIAEAKTSLKKFYTAFEMSVIDLGM
jgi:hypothetical protein